MICVDNAFYPARVGKLNSRWCHLYTDEPDNPEEIEKLHRFAGQIGLQRRWFQEDLRLPHYDLTEGKRKQAVLYGAVEVSIKKTAEVMEVRMAKRRAEFDAALSSS